MALDLDVVVDVDAALLPLREDVARGGQGPPRRAVELLVQRAAAEFSRFVTARLGRREAVSTPGLLAEIHATFGVVLHRRTLEKLVRDLRSKKTLAADAHTAGPSRLAADRAATHYERLRGRWMETARGNIRKPCGCREDRWVTWPRPLN